MRHVTARSTQTKRLVALPVGTQKRWGEKLLSSIFIVCLCHSVSAQTTESSRPTGQVRYISDIIFVPLRSGAGNEFRIINSRLKSGIQLTFLELSEDGNWSKVITEKGTEGWIRSQYLSEFEPARQQLVKAQTRIQSLETQNKSLAAQNQALSKSNQSLDTQAKTSKDSQTQMETELQRIKNLAAGAIDLEKRYKALLEKQELLQTEHEALQAENEQYKNDQRFAYMYKGGGLILFGVILAFIIPALKPKKRFSEWA